MDGLDLYQRLNDGLKELRKANYDMKEAGWAFAQAERDYKIAKAKKILQLRAKGYPVTLCQDVTLGCDDVASLRFERDCAEVEYETSRELVWSLKLELRLIDGEIDRQTRGR